MLIYCDGRPASVDDLQSLALANQGHFTSMQVRGRAVRGLDLHLRRLRAGTREVFDLALDDARVLAGMAAALDASGLDDARMRVTVVARDFDMGKPDLTRELSLLVSLAPLQQVDPAALWLKGCRYERMLPQVKHVGLFPLLQLRRQARREGFDDALLLDGRGWISEGTTWNIGFWDGRSVVWPQAPALRGTCERLLQIGLDVLAIPQRQQPLALRDVAGFRAAFACNAAGIQAVRGIDDIGLRGEPELLERLHEALDSQPWQALPAAAAPAA